MGNYELNKNLAQMLKGGVIMDVTNVEQAKIAEAAGACAVMALERVPSDIRKDGGVARMSDPQMIKAIKNAVSIPVMAKVRIGHFVEAQILEAIGIDYIDESEVLTPADDLYHVDKTAFKVPFVCGCRNLGEALRRIGEGASMIRTKGEAGTGNVVEAVRHMRQLNNDIHQVQVAPVEALMTIAKEMGAPYDLVKFVHENGKLPVVNFAAGGIAFGPTFGLFGEYSGAKNNPEVVAPLNRLRSLLQPVGATGGEVNFRIRDRYLEGVLQRRNNRVRRTR